MDMKLKPNEALILRTCNADMTSHGGFKWKRRGVVTAPDWSPKPECDNGLHGFLWGEGDGSLVKWYGEVVWIVAVVSEWVDLGRKVKFPFCRVVYAGDRLTATNLIQEHRRGAIVGCTATAGDYGTATAGHNGTATAGHNGTATSGDYGTATAGDYGTAIAGYSGAAAAGYYGITTAGHNGTATSGDYGTATSGDYGTATSGDYGTATAGYRGVIQLRYYDSDYARRRIKTGYIGENGLKPNIPYRLNDKREFVGVV